MSGKACTHEYCLSVPVLHHLVSRDFDLFVCLSVRLSQRLCHLVSRGFELSVFLSQHLHHLVSRGFDLFAVSM